MQKMAEENSELSEIKEKVGLGSDTRNVETVKEFLQSICDEIEDGNLRAGSEEYRDLMMNTTIDSDVLIDIWDSPDQTDCVRLSAMSNNFIRGSSSPESAQSILERHEDQFCDDPLYQYCVYSAHKDSKYPKYWEKAFLAGRKAVEGIETNSFLYAGVASTGVDIVRKSDLTPIEIGDEQLSEENILSECAEYAERATIVSPDGTGWYLIYASVLELQNEFEKALEVLRDGHRRKLEIGGPVEQFEDQIDELRKNQARYELEEQIEDAEGNLNSLKSDLDDIESDLEETTDRYRTQIFQFVGFFAAILTIALTSVQIATQLSFPQSAGLVLVLIGGITLAFGELQILFDSEDSHRWYGNYRSYIIGAVLIGSGLFIGL